MPPPEASTSTAVIRESDWQDAPIQNRRQLVVRCPGCNIWNEIDPSEISDANNTNLRCRKRGCDYFGLVQLENWLEQ